MLKGLFLKFLPLVILTVFLGYGQMAEAADKSGAVIRLVQDRINFGEVAPRSSHTFTFEFENVGSETLVISRIQSTCGCTVPELKKTKYEPGETGEIKTIFTSSRRDGPERHTLYIHSNDVENPRRPMYVESTTVLKVVAEPQRIDLAVTQENAGFPELKIISRENTEFAITSISTPGNPFKFDIDSSKKAVEHILVPEVNIEALKRHLSGVINIRTDHPGAAALSVSYNTPPQYSASPARIIIQNATVGNAETRDIWIRNNYGEDIEVLGVRSQNLDIDYEITRQTDGMALMKVTIKTPDRKGQARYFSDDIAVSVKDAAEDVIIKVSGWYSR